MPAMQSAVLADELSRAVRNGVPFGRSLLDPEPEDGPVRLFDEDHRLLAVYAAEGSRVTPEVVLP